jgi:hypothetical protein
MALELSRGEFATLQEAIDAATALTFAHGVPTASPTPAAVCSSTSAVPPGC